MTTRILLIISTLALAGGLFVPWVQVSPTFGNPVLDYFAPVAGFDMTPSNYSLLGGIIKLFNKGSWLIGLLLLACSVCFPVTKQLRSCFKTCVSGS